MDSTILFKEESFKIMGACFEVYKEKGCGFLEGVYQECLAMEFKMKGVPFVEQPCIRLDYKGSPLNHTYEPDFLCYGEIIVELKAVKQLMDDHRAQAINYLKATGMRLALLINFGHYPQLEYERLLH